MPNPRMLKPVHSPPWLGVWEDLQSAWQHLEMTSQDNWLFFFLSHVDLRVESVLRMVLDRVKSSEAMWDWGNFCSQCLFRNRIRQEMFVWGFWKVCHNFVSGDLKTSLRIKCLLITERKKWKSEREGDLSSFTTSLWQNPVPKLPGSAFTLHWRVQILVFPQTVI